MENLKLIRSLKKELELTHLKIKNLQCELQNTYVYECDSVWNCGECLKRDGEKRDLEAQYEYGENAKKITRWMECKFCGWNDKLPGIIKKYIYKSVFSYKEIIPS